MHLMDACHLDMYNAVLQPAAPIDAKENFAALWINRTSQLSSDMAAALAQGWQCRPLSFQVYLQLHNATILRLVRL